MEDAPRSLVATAHRTSVETHPLMPGTSAGGVGPNTVEAFVRIRLAAQTEPEMFEAWLLWRTAVCGLWSLAGDFDYEVRLACTDLHDLAAHVRALRRFGADQTFTCLVLREVKSDYSRDD